MRVGFQPGYPSPKDTAAPPISNTVRTILAMSCLEEAVELRWLVSMRMSMAGFIVYGGPGLVEVSTTPGIVLAHGIHTVRCGIDGLQQSLGGIFVNGFGTGCFRFEYELEVRVNDGIFCLHFGGKDIQVCAQGMLVGIGYGNYRVCFAGNGVAQVTTVLFTAKVHVRYFWDAWLRKRSAACCIAAPQVYVAAGVSAFQPFTCTLQQKYPAGTSTSR